ncbi:SIR2 family NAD-dependent protein deacylase [Ornithinimicrobium pekingense]|uniref:NAD-dependent protein deacylase n=1 Tax=Ornithinimicrobium pekingense TaxID=384677 RepID=A0ABQ2F6J6_9MICO|nr:NAD-dependent deacylase [Ornithinimicrobium pekingense]GGK57134.1 NAD-dependent protein deacylase [Ornithinimicrobium pekingense]
MTSLTDATDQVPEAILDLARGAARVCVLTGAGMSAESGIPTFRDVQVGLWERFDPAELASPQAWERDHAQVWAWYAWRASLVRRAAPNAGHEALAAWQRRPGVDLAVVTQNVDDLHERAGAEVLAHVHGSLFTLRCARCDRPSDAAYPEVTGPVGHLDPPVCGVCGGPVRPGVVWFGEALPEADFLAGADAAREADLVLVVGTSGLVHPAATIPHLAGARGVPVVEVNPRETAVSEAADEVWRAPAAEALPALVAALAGATPPP